MVAADAVVEQLRAVSRCLPRRRPGTRQGRSHGIRRASRSVRGRCHRSRPRRPARPRQLPAASVPVVLLSLGALCLLVAAAVFVAVAWSALGLTGRTLVLLGVTALLSLVAVVLTRKDLRGAAETFWLVVAGMLVVDLLGAQSAGLLGLDALDWRGTALLVGAALFALGVGVGAWALGEPVGRLYGSEAVAVLGAAIAVSTNGWFAADPAIACTVADPAARGGVRGPAARAPRGGVRHGRAGRGDVAGPAPRRLGPCPRDGDDGCLVVRRPRLAAAGGGRSWPPCPCTCPACPGRRARWRPARRCSHSWCWPMPRRRPPPAPGTPSSQSAVLIALAGLAAFAPRAWAQGAGALAAIGVLGLGLALAIAPWDVLSGLGSDGTGPIDLPLDGPAPGCRRVDRRGHGGVDRGDAGAASCAWSPSRSQSVARRCVTAVAPAVLALGGLVLVLQLEPPLWAGVLAAAVATGVSGAAAWSVRDDIVAGWVGTAATAYLGVILFRAASVDDLLLAIALSALAASLVAVARRTRASRKRGLRRGRRSTRVGSAGGGPGRPGAAGWTSARQTVALVLAGYAALVGVLAAPVTVRATSRVTLECRLLAVGTAAVAFPEDLSTSAMSLTIVGSAICLVSVLNRDREPAGWLGAAVLGAATVLRVGARRARSRALHAARGRAARRRRASGGCAPTRSGQLHGARQRPDPRRSCRACCSPSTSRCPARRAHRCRRGAGARDRGAPAAGGPVRARARRPPPSWRCGTSSPWPTPCRAGSRSARSVWPCCSSGSPGRRGGATSRPPAAT